MPTRTDVPNRSSTSRSNVVLPAPGDDMIVIVPVVVMVVVVVRMARSVSVVVEASHR